VRKLAEKTSKSTQEISAMTETITNSTNEAVAEMEAAVGLVKSGASLAAQAGTAIVGIKEGVRFIDFGIKNKIDVTLI